MLQIGSVVDGKYKILSLIGKGGMSAVYLAINERANKPWAIKEVRKDSKQDFLVMKQSLIMETNLLKKLKHPHLPSIVDVIEQDDMFLIVMDYIEGVTLKRLLDEHGAQRQEDVVNWAIQLCDVLDYLHTRKPSIIYRDMKPSNIMVKSDGSVVLIDFGTAREYKESHYADTTCLGTQGYAAPEQFGGQGQTDARTDIYCLGATMYHLVTGKNPAKAPYEMYPITKWNATLSTGLEKIILKCTQRNPNDRFQSVGELKYALEHYKDLDRPLLRKYKMSLLTFCASLLCTVVCGIGAIGFQEKARATLRNEYDYLLTIAEKSTTKTKTVEYFLKSIDTDPTRADAYAGLLEKLIEDGVLDENEESVIQELNVSVEKYFEQFQRKNPSAYADFCYDVGNAYWFYYTHEESRKSGAVKWFQEAAFIYESETQHQMEIKRCEIYIELGSFYKRIINAQMEGNDGGMYGEYWNSLVALKRANDEMPDRELITLRLYEEIVSKSMEYAKYLKEDGIMKEEIISLYEEIAIDCEGMKGRTTSVGVLDEIERVRALIEKSDMLLSSGFS